MRFETKKVILIAAVIFFLALFLRVYNLGENDLGSDEGLWMERGSNMITKLRAGNFKESVKNFERHPGIPAAFLMGLSMKTLGKENTAYQYNIAKPASFSLKILDPLTAARLPITILGALACAFLFIFVYYSISFKAALLSSIILSFEPFHIAASRMAHQDVALGLFVMSSLFCYYLGEKKKKEFLKILAGIFFGLALLTKVIALIILLIIIIWKIITYILKHKKESFSKENIFTYTDAFLVIIGFLMFFIFYPNMWGNIPYNFTMHLLQNFGTSAVKDDHFFLGVNTHEKTPLFYIFSIFLRMPFIILTAFIIGIIASFINAFKNKKRKLNILLLLTFFLFLFSLMAVGKIQERYLIPVWQFTALFSALGIMFILKKIRTYKKTYFGAILAVIVILGIFNFIKNVPNFYLYYNILAGNSENIMKIMPIGRGEGLKQTAEYLNKKQEGMGRKLNVFSTYSKFFKTYSESNVIGWNDQAWNETNIFENIDYYVIYIRDIQQRSPDLLYRKIFLEKKPEKIIRLNNINVVWIFKNK